ncbi:hypothetical protein [Klebsiella indica]|uniref:hypothetical protein n=1 Tax=Klebsiella indica TaxID=2582917 RepID=UPI0031B6D9D6
MKRRDLLRGIAFSPFAVSFLSIGKEKNKLLPNSSDEQDTNHLVTPDMFGAKPDGVFNNKEAIEKALQYASLKGVSCVFLQGNYYSDDININIPVQIIIRSGSYLNFQLSIIGEIFCSENNLKINQGWKSFSVGRYSFPNKSTKVQKGDLVGFSLDSDHGGSAQFGNENGIDVLKVIDANESTFEVKDGIRFPYEFPIISKLKNVVSLKDDLHKGSYLIKGDFSSEISPGDVIRIENMDGTDGVAGSKYYFEYVKVKSVNSEHINLISRTVYSYTNPWIIKSKFLNRVELVGQGRIKKLTLRYIDDLQISSLFINRLIISNCHNVNVHDLNLEGLSEPSTLNITYCFGKNIFQNLRVSNSESSSDNATLKVMSSPQTILSNIVISDSNSDSKKQSNYSLFIDAFYTPYSCWNDNIILHNVICERPKSNFKRGIWFYGMRNSVIESVLGADVFLQGSLDSYFTNFNISEFNLEIKDLVRCNVNSKCTNALIKGGVDNIFKLEIAKFKSNNSEVKSYNCIFTAGTVNPETGDNYIHGGNNYLNFKNAYPENKNNLFSIDIEYQNDLVIEPVSALFFNIKESINIGRDVSGFYIKNNLEKVK